MNSTVPLVVGLITGTTASALAESSLRWQEWAPLPLTEGFAGGFAGVSNDALIFAGGTNFAGRPPWEGGTRIWSDHIYVLTGSEGIWQSSGKLPHALGYGASVSTPDGLVIIGGCVNDKPVDEVWLLRWDGRSIQTEPLPPLPLPTGYCSAVLQGRTIFCVASPIDASTKVGARKFWRLNLDRLSEGWSDLAPWPGAPRTMAVMAVSGEEIFLFSGKAADPALPADQAYLTDAFAYHVAKGTWRTLAPLPFPASAVPSPAPVVDGKILILGGNDGSLARVPPGPQRPDFPSTVYEYDVAGNSWQLGAALPFSQKVTPVVPWREAWIVVSGERQPGLRTNTVWAGQTSH